MTVEYVLMLLFLKKGKCGRKYKDHSEQLTNVKKVPFKLRESIRSLFSVVAIPKPTMFNICKRGKNIKHIYIFYCLLTDQNKLERIKFCFSNVRPNGRFEMCTIMYTN